MTIAIRKSDVDKLNLTEIEELFEAYHIDELNYNSSDLTKQLDEIIFKFNYLKEEKLTEYLRARHVSGRILR